MPLQDLLVLHRAATASYPQHQSEWDAWILHVAEPLVAVQHPAPWRLAPAALPALLQCILRCTSTPTTPQRAQLDALRMATTLLHAHKSMVRVLVSTRATHPHSSLLQVDTTARSRLLSAASRLARVHPGQQGFTEQQVQALTAMHAAATHAGCAHHPALEGAATVLAGLLDWCGGFRRRPLEQRPWSRLYVALLRACAAVFAEVRVGFQSISTSCTTHTSSSSSRAFQTQSACPLSPHVYVLFSAMDWAAGRPPPPPVLHPPGGGGMYPPTCGGVLAPTAAAATAAPARLTATAVCRTRCVAAACAALRYRHSRRSPAVTPRACMACGLCLCRRLVTSPSGGAWLGGCRTRSPVCGAWLQRC